jgi:hypothetical protein
MEQDNQDLLSNQQVNISIYLLWGGGGVWGFVFFIYLICD